MLKLPDGAPMGPLALDIVAELVRQGEVTEDYLYTSAGADDWHPLRELPGLPESAFRAQRANKLKTGKADFGQLLTSSLAAAATYTALFLPTPRRHHLAEVETWLVIAVGVLVIGIIQAIVAFGVFRHLNLPRIGKELVVVVLVSFWFLPILLLRDLAGELDSGFSYIAVICLALVTAPFPILLCLFNRFFDRK